MNFSKEWDQRYKENTHMSIWPWSDVVSYVMRYTKQYDDGFRVLELGCGAGANIPFFESLGAEYYAIEGSKAIVENLHKKYPQLQNRLKVGDFTTGFFFDKKFHVIVDRSSLTHNSTVAIRKCLEYIYTHLLDEGRYIGIDWFSTSYSEYCKGKITDDIWTRTNYTQGPLSHTGNVHFSDRGHLLDLSTSPIIL